MSTITIKQRAKKSFEFWILKIILERKKKENVRLEMQKKKSNDENQPLKTKPMKNVEKKLKINNEITAKTKKIYKLYDECFGFMTKNF